ncbi:hypothetical protein HGA88_05945 [Candidatus Roizmanbacteria bacterium]|nr:hypothetical protein [Candidatus Roizmanbacteria bacterium]
MQPSESNNPIDNLRQFLYPIFGELVQSSTVIALVLFGLFGAVIGVLYFISRFIFQIP